MNSLYLADSAILVFLELELELMNHFLASYLYSVCGSAGEKFGETDSPLLIKYLTSPPPFLCAFPQMEKQMVSLEPMY